MSLKYLFLALGLLLGIGQLPAQDILVFSKTNGYRHATIDQGVSALKKLALDNKWQAIFSEQESVFRPEKLSQFQVIIFLSTSGDIFDEDQQRALEQFIKNGGGFVGIHAASTTEYEWVWYKGLVGAYFKDHPPIQQARLIIHDSDHPSVTHLGPSWTRIDEWYNFRTQVSQSCRVLISLDETSITGGTMGAHHPISWYQFYDGGRSFYTAMGHTAESYHDILFLQHLKGAIQWAMGRNE